MATTIVTKSGSGAPTASDLVAGELAVDLTNKRLYTEDSGGTVLEVGSNPYNFTANHDGSAKLATTATGIDVTGTATAKSLVLGSPNYIGDYDTGVFRQINIGEGGNVATFFGQDNGSAGGIISNAVLNASNQIIYSNSTNEISRLYLYDGTFVFSNAPSGTAGAVATPVERLRIDASGNLLVGTTSASIYNDTSGNGIQLNGGSGQIVVAKQSSSTSDPALWLNNTGVDGSIVTFAKDGASVGSIGIESGGFYIDGEAAHSGLSFGGNSVVARDNGTRVDNTVDLGSSVYRFKDLYLSGHVQLGAAENISWGGAYNTGKPTITAGSDFIVFYPEGITSGEAMRIDSSGNVGIGVAPAARFDVMATGANQWYIRNTDGTAQDNSITSLRSGGYSNIALDGASVQSKIAGATKVEVASNGSLYLYAQATGAGNADLRYATSSGQVTYDTSSRLVKAEIEDIPYGLSTVMALSPKRYQRTDSDNKLEVGFIADEVVEVVPELVGMMEKRFLTMNQEDTEMVAGSVEYNKMTAVLVKAIQEQQATIEALTARIAALES